MYYVGIEYRYWNNFLNSLLHAVRPKYSKEIETEYQPVLQFIQKCNSHDFMNNNEVVVLKKKVYINITS